MATSEFTTSAESHVSTRQTTSGLFAAQRAASSSILGSRLLQLKYKTEKNLFAEKEKLQVSCFGSDSPPPPVKCFVQASGWDGVVNDVFTIELQLFCITAVYSGCGLHLACNFFNWFHAPFITL